jgi:hypothetical protein
MTLLPGVLDLRRHRLPARDILRNQAATGRISKWAVELGTLNIDFKPRTAIKSQALVVPKGQVLRADFSQSSGVECCFLAGSSSELWKWHRKLGHLSFDLLSPLSKFNLVRGLPRLRLEKELVCAPCRHAKMVASSHPPLTDVMTERPCELLHMDLFGPARVRSAGGKWYVLVVVDDYSRYAWVFFLEDKGETFGFV